MSAYSAIQVARKYGYRSGLEDRIAAYLKDNRIKFLYEKVKIEWEDLAYRTYTPDFILPNGIIIETKGRFTSSDRRKHKCIKKQHPELDIRFIFTNSRSKLQKGAKTSYGEWYECNNILYADRIIPEEWLYEKGKKWNINTKKIKFKLKKIRR